MKIRIVRAKDFPFPYGRLGKENREFVEDFEGEEFSAERNCMNYYRLKNGMLVHLYNATEVDKPKS